MKNMLAGAFIAAALSLGVFVATLVFGPRLFFPTPQTKSLAVEVEPQASVSIAPTLVPAFIPLPTSTTTALPTATETPAPATATATIRPATATPPPTPTLTAAGATPTIPAPPEPVATDASTLSAATGLPDLVVLWLVPTYVWLDDDTVRVSISVTVRNNGLGSAGAFWVRAHIDDQPDAVLHRASVRWLVPELAPGAEVRLESESVEGAKEILLGPGNYFITAEVNGEADGVPRLIESDTGNNVLGPLDLPVRGAA